MPTRAARQGTGRGHGQPRPGNVRRGHAAWGDWTRRKVPSRHAPASARNVHCLVSRHLRASCPRAGRNDRLEALRLAGLSEWPYGIEGDPAHQLKGEAIDASTFGHAWEGERVGSGPSSCRWKRMAPSSTWADHAGHRAASRKAIFVPDVSALHLGRPLCGPIYSNPMARRTSRMSTPT